MRFSTLATVALSVAAAAPISYAAPIHPVGSDGGAVASSSDFTASQSSDSSHYYPGGMGKHGKSTNSGNQSAGGNNKPQPKPKREADDLLFPRGKKPPKDGNNKPKPTPKPKPKRETDDAFDLLFPRGKKPPKDGNNKPKPTPKPKPKREADDAFDLLFPRGKKPPKDGNNKPKPTPKPKPKRETDDAFDLLFPRGKKPPKDGNNKPKPTPKPKPKREADDVFDMILRRELEREFVRRQLVSGYNVVTDVGEAAGELLSEWKNSGNSRRFVPEARIGTVVSPEPRDESESEGSGANIWVSAAEGLASAVDGWVTESNYQQRDDAGSGASFLGSLVGDAEDIYDDYTGGSSSNSRRELDVLGALLRRQETSQEESGASIWSFLGDAASDAVNYFSNQSGSS